MLDFRVKTFLATEYLDWITYTYYRGSSHSVENETKKISKSAL